MKRFFYLFFLLSVFGNIKGQEKIVHRSGYLTVNYFMAEIYEYEELGKQPLGFEEKLELLGMTYLPNKQFTFSEHALDYYLEKPCCDNESCKLSDELLVYSAKFIHEDMQCEIFISNLSADFIRYNGKIGKSSKGPAFLSYERVLDYLISDRDQVVEKAELERNLHYYPQDSTRMIFNADYMFRYNPVYMKGNKHGDNFMHTIAVVTGRKGLDIFAYFVLTDESVKYFDKYLSDFRHTLWFKDE